MIEARIVGVNASRYQKTQTRDAAYFLSIMIVDLSKRRFIANGVHFAHILLRLDKSSKEFLSLTVYALFLILLEYLEKVSHLVSLHLSFEEL